ncbi:putative myb dna-binding domain protein [Botrytis fragariae]|uniref:Putative myb dna-binding domain protein n=1 Tax=Botrytis fragariae TaxID=1964551 RepID=A0A8H6AMS3_9HELO|nr:putative myb dna-binding domain protein [Botrytis fragariae]KAF5870461.1 putative myb dna-binding domain protein [Botrytis fragariae]
MNQSTREPAAPSDTSLAQQPPKNFSNLPDLEDFSAFFTFPAHSPPTIHPMSKRVDRQEIDPNASFQLSHNHPSTADTSTLKSEVPSPASSRNKRRASGPATATNTSVFNMQAGSSIAGPSSAGLDDPNMASSMAPPAKKSRTNTPWTPAEEQRLKNMRDAGNSWADIAKDMHYAEFAEDESQALLAAIKDYEANKWKAIGQKVGKPAKACEQYAKDNFSGKI